MADLEQLAVKRDRRYLVRLIALLALGLAASVFLWQGLTGNRVSGCLAGAFLGQDSSAPPAVQPRAGEPAQ